MRDFVCVVVGAAVACVSMAFALIVLQYLSVHALVSVVGHVFG